MEELQQSQQESIISDNDIPLTKKKRTINAPRSEKHIEAFKKAQEKRDDNQKMGPRDNKKFHFFKGIVI